MSPRPTRRVLQAALRGALVGSVAGATLAGVLVLCLAECGDDPVGPESLPSRSPS